MSNVTGIKASESTHRVMKIYKTWRKSGLSLRILNKRINKVQSHE